MTRARCKELLPVMTAYANGEAVEYRNRRQNPDAGWQDVGDGSFNFELSGVEWRVKPKPVEVWVVYNGNKPIGCCNSRNEALGMTPCTLPYRVVHMREVVE